MWKKIKNLFAKVKAYVTRLLSKTEVTIDIVYNDYLKEEDFLDLGFEKVSENTKYIDFVKGSLNLKWGYRPSMRTLSIRWGNSPRFFGICETKGDLVYLLILIEKYFRK